MNIKSYAKTLQSKTDILLAWFLKWFFGEIAFAILPVLVICMLSEIFNQKMESLLLLPELGFATIIILGASINHFIELKVLVQKDTSYKVFMGTRLAVLLMIFAVLSLAFIYMRDDNQLLNDSVLKIFQLTLFLLSLFFIGGAIAEKEKIYCWRVNLPRRIQKRSYIKQLKYSLKTIEDEIDYLRYVIHEYDRIEFDISENYYDIKLFDAELVVDMRYRFQDIHRKLKNATTEIENGLLKELSTIIEDK